MKNNNEIFYFFLLFCGTMEMKYEEVEEVVMLSKHELINALVEFDHLFFSEVALENRNHLVLEFQKSEIVTKFASYLMKEDRFSLSMEQLKMLVSESLKRIPYLFISQMPYDERLIVNFSVRDALAYLNKKYPLEKDESISTFARMFYQSYQLECVFKKEDREDCSSIPDRKRRLNIYPYFKLDNYVLCQGTYNYDTVTWELWTDGKIKEIPSTIEIPSYYMYLNPKKENSLINIRLQEFHQVEIQDFSYILYQGTLKSNTSEYLNRSLYIESELDFRALRELSSPSIELEKEVKGEVPGAYQKKLTHLNQPIKKLSV